MLDRVEVNRPIWVGAPSSAGEVRRGEIWGKYGCIGRCFGVYLCIGRTILVAVAWSSGLRKSYRIVVVTVAVTRLRWVLQARKP